MRFPLPKFRLRSLLVVVGLAPALAWWIFQATVGKTPTYECHVVFTAEGRYRQPPKLTYLLMVREHFPNGIFQESLPLRTATFTVVADGDSRDYSAYVGFSEPAKAHLTRVRLCYDPPRFNRPATPDVAEFGERLIDAVVRSITADERQRIAELRQSNPRRDANPVYLRFDLPRSAATFHARNTIEELLTLL